MSDILPPYGRARVAADASRSGFPHAGTRGLFLVEDADLQLVPYIGHPTGEQTPFAEAAFYAAQRAQGIHWPDDPTYGAVGDGVTDDTTAVHAAMTAAKAVKGRCQFTPGKKYRVTSMFTQSVAKADVHIRGGGTDREGSTTSYGTEILLDSASAAVGFMAVTASCHVTIEDITFRCAQYVQDRPFIRFTSSYYLFNWRNVNFESVERPIVFGTGSYFQASSLTNVQFRNSGTLHSEATGTNLFGTLLVLDNINHEGSVPVNTEKIVCNLSGIRHTVGRNVLFEGTLPATGWTVLKTFDGYDAEWTRAPTAEFHGFWCEWSGASAPAYSVDQQGGTVRFSSARLGLTASTKYKLSDSGTAVIEASGFSTTDQIEDLFEFEDYQCNVTFRNCGLRRGDLTHKQLTMEQCSLIVDGSSPQRSSTIVSTDAATPVFRWDGGYFDGDAATLSTFGGASGTPSTDATYGRKYAITPGSATDVSFHLTVKARDVVVQYSQVGLVARFRLPTWTAGTIAVTGMVNGASVGQVESYASSESGTIVEMRFPFRVTTAAPSTLGIAVAPSGVTGLTGTFDILAFAVYVGNAIPRTEYASFPKNIETWRSAAPTGGTWIVGDRVYNTAPAASGTIGWVCTTAGTPGTWKTFGTISA